jgi:glycosyltransferase involved in cell wall biosynthesis
MSLLERILQFTRLGARLVYGQLRRGPGALADLFRDTVLTFFGKSSVDRNRESTVVVGVMAGEDEPPAKKRRMAAFITQFGLGLLRQGNVEDAKWVLERGVGWFAADRRLRAAADVVDGEHVVLSGAWQPVPIVGRRGLVDHAPGRVLHVVGKSLPQTLAGYTVRTQSVVTAQRSVGLDPAVVTKLGFPWYLGGDADAAIEHVDGIPHYRLGDGDLPRRWDDRLDANLAALGPIVEQVRPRVLHAHSDFENPLLALALGEQFDLPVVYEVRGFWEETWLSKSPERSPEADRFRWRHERELACIQRADHVVTLAETMRSRMAADGVDPARVTIVPNAVDPAEFPVMTRNEELAASLGIAPSEVTVGYISSLVSYEGVDTLVEALRLARDAGLPVRGLIVGDGDQRAGLEQLAAARGVADVVRFTGRVPYDEVLDYYSLIDVFVVPRRNDRVCRLVTPLKPFEAMSTGRALVMSAVPALAAIASESGAAVTFEPENAADLAGVLGRLVGDGAARAELAERGATWVRENRTWADNAQRYLEIYRELGVID